MPRKRLRDYKVRDLSTAKPGRSASRNKDGSRRNGVTPAFRAAIVNGTPFLVTRSGKQVDRRTHAGRRFEALIYALVSDLGGPQNTSVAEMELVRRAAAIAVDLAFAEAQAINNNEPLDPHIYHTMADTQRRILQALGLRRRARDVTPRLSDILEGHAREVADA